MRSFPFRLRAVVFTVIAAACVAVPILADPAAPAKLKNASPGSSLATTGAAAGGEAADHIRRITFDPKLVDKMREDATAFLLRAQQPDGTQWEASATPKPNDDGLDGRRWGVTSAAAVIALTGFDRHLKETTKALTWLSSKQLGLQAHAMALRSRLRVRFFDKPAIARGLEDEKQLTQVLLGIALSNDGPPDTAERAGDWEASVLGGQILHFMLRTWGDKVHLPLDVRLDKQWRALQGADGSWAPTPDASIADRVRTTANAIALLVAIRRDNPPLFQAYGASKPDAAVLKGFKWLDGRSRDELLSVRSLPSLYEAGSATGRKRFAGVDWFGEGVLYVKKLQQADGSISDSADPTTRIYETALALSFLNEADVPTSFAKLRYGPEAANESEASALDVGDQRPFDVANLSVWLGRQLCWGQLNWQYVLPSTELQDLRDAPVLLVCGKLAPELDDAAVDRLRRYVESGGLILGNADMGSDDFSNGFRKLGSRLFPQYFFRELPQTHPVYNICFSSRHWMEQPKVEGLSNGVRELMILMPQGDPSRYWERRNAKLHDWQYELGMNIYAYAAGRGHYFMLSEHYALDPAPKPATRPLRVAVATPNAAGIPEPAAWPNMARAMLASDGVAVEAAANDLAKELPALKAAERPLLHLTGTGKFGFDAAQRAALRRYIDSGGTILIDAAGGNADFAQSAMAELQAMFPDQNLKELQPIAKDDPLYYATDGEPMRRVGWRSWAIGQGGIKYAEPRLVSIEVGGRRAVFYSGEDLTAGMAGIRHEGILGYEPAFATDIVRRVVRYVLDRTAHRDDGK